MKSTQALSSAALLAMAKAQDVITLGDGPEGVSWDSVTKSANLTASQNFTGRDVSSSYPGSAQGGWEVSLALKDNVAVEGSDDLLTARTITMSAPEGNNATIDDSWRVCAHVFPVSSSEGWGQEFDTNCKGLVAPECVDDLMKEGRKKFGAGCPSWKITPSCLRDLEEQKGDSVILNDALVSGNSSFYRSAEGTHAADDDSNTNYLEAANKAVAVVSIFGASGESDDDPYAQVRCLLPDTVEGASFDPTPDEATSGLSKFVGWAALTGAVSLQFLF